MSWLDSALSAAGDVASSAASSSDSWWSTGIDYGTKAFGWVDDIAGGIQKYPEASKLLAGVVGGVGTYMSGKEQNEAEADLLEKRFQMEQDAARIVPGQSGPRLTSDDLNKSLTKHGLLNNPNNPYQRGRGHGMG